MFNIGPFELMVLAIVGIVVVGPDRLPALARDAARMLRTLRDLATGARQQLRDELGPEFSDVDLRNLNPRTALTRAVFGDEEDLESLRKLDPRRWDARSAARNLVDGADDDADDSVDFTKRSGANGHSGPGARTDVASGGTLGGSSANSSSANGSSVNGASRPRPRPRPGPATPYDADAT